MIPEPDMHSLKSLSRAARGGTLDPLRLAEKAYTMGAARRNATPETLNLAEIERIALIKAIRRTGNIIAASRLLGIGKTTAYRKAKEYGLTQCRWRV